MERRWRAMQDLNDLYFFSKVVEHEGFAAASRVLGIPKSTLSRRVSLLEERLGARLLQRSTRRFAVTEIGQDYYRHCLAMVAEAEAAQEAVERVQAEPQGLIRVSCPVMLSLTSVAPLVSRFLVEYPRVQGPVRGNESARGRDRGGLRRGAACPHATIGELGPGHESAGRKYPVAGRDPGTGRPVGPPPIAG
jgi:DNA-binding transcriptional LysR family regulator